jgi:CRP-like cAMP-binding protein
MLESLPYIPLFQDLGPAQIAILKPLFELYACPPESTIFEQGEPASYLYLLLNGEVVIHYKPYDGPPITITRLREGDVFGWSAVIGNAKYTSSIISETQVSALQMRGDDLWKLARNHPETGKIIIDRLVHIVSPRWKNAHAQIQTLLNSSQSE